MMDARVGPASAAVSNIGSQSAARPTRGKSLHGDNCQTGLPTGQSTELQRKDVQMTGRLDTVKHLTQAMRLRELASGYAPVPVLCKTRSRSQVTNFGTGIHGVVRKRRTS